MQYQLDPEKIKNFDEISQEVAHWRFVSGDKTIRVTILKYVQGYSKNEFGGFFYYESDPNEILDCCGDFYEDENSALNHLIFLMRRKINSQRDQMVI